MVKRILDSWQIVLESLFEFEKVLDSHFDLYVVLNFEWSMKKYKNQDKNIREGMPRPKKKNHSPKVSPKARVNTWKYVWSG